MRSKTPLWSLAAALLLLGGCSTAEKLTRRALAATPQGRRILADWGRYERLARVFKKYHDKGNLDEGAVLDVLWSAGVLKRAPAGRKPRVGPAPRKPAAKPFPLPAYKGAWRWPMDAGVVSSEYGPRWGKLHHGVDIAADMGKPIRAAAPGEVIYSGDALTGYGNVVFLRHDQDTVSIYAHNKSLKVKVGQKIRCGQVVAALGSTGHSTGPHLHFEVRKEGESIPPRTLLPNSRF